MADMAGTAMLRDQSSRSGTARLLPSRSYSSPSGRGWVRANTPCASSLKRLGRNLALPSMLRSMRFRKSPSRRQGVRGVFRVVAGPPTRVAQVRVRQLVRDDPFDELVWTAEQGAL